MEKNPQIYNINNLRLKEGINNDLLTGNDYKTYLYPLMGKNTPDVIKKVILCYYAFMIKVRIRPLRFIFLLAHMRSGSTLLTHILNRNPDITGATESGIFYHTKKDLLLSIYWVHLCNRNVRFKAKFVIDQINHNRFLPDDELLEEKGMSFIFLIREPLKSLNSMLTNPYRYYSTTRTEEGALFYYVSRLQKLEYYARRINDKVRTVFFTHDKLINQTDQVFKKLMVFLELSKPLSESYRILPITGRRSDHSDNIYQGHIVRNYESPKHHISAMNLRIAQYFFDRCCETLSEYCSTVS